jgi:hypothetical protein
MITLILLVFALPTISTLIMIGITFLTKDSQAQKKWWREQILISYDQLVNSYFRGWADETISSRAYRKKDKTLEKIINMIFFWQESHCEQAYENEKQRNQLPPEMRGD